MHDMDSYSDNLTSNPLWKLPITDPRCENASCFEFVYGYLEDQSRFSNYQFPLYAQWTVFFYSATLLIFCMWHLYQRFDDQSNRTRLKEKTVAYWRMLNYRRLSGNIGSQIDLSYGQLTLLSAATIFITILPFFEGYYLRGLFRYGSPPLSVRCAMLISALLPMCLALAGKVNIVTLLTGISYAKLNLWHRYVAYVIYALSIIHLVPHFIAPVKEGGMAELADLFRDHRRELSGSVLFSSFTLMLVASLPWVRNRVYEAFKILHIILAILFVVFLFWHINGEYIAPDYLYASIAILIANFLSRMIYRNRVAISLSDFVQGFPTSLEVLKGGVTRVVIHCPPQFRWQPGQHVFISIPGISVLQSHPFTVASVSWPISMQGRNDVILLVRALKGFTRNLAELATKSTDLSRQSVDRLTAIAEAQKLRFTTRCWVDGPYGDSHPALDRKYQSVICVSGGSGITASLPWVSYLAGKIRSAAHSPRSSGGKLCKTRSIHLIWSVRSLDWIGWAERELFDALHHVMRANDPGAKVSKIEEITDIEQIIQAPTKPRGRLKITIYVTSREVKETEMKTAEQELLHGAGIELDNPYVQVEVLGGRPNYMQLLPTMVDKKRNIILACGPQGQKIDVANSAATLQRLVVENKTKEIALHTETFGW